MPTDWSGLTILITRPAHQAGPLQQQIEQQQGQACCFPLLDISSVDESTQLTKLLTNLAEYDIAIFISPNAVEYGLKLTGALPPNLKLATVGNATARKLTQLSGREPDICPHSQFDSEGLLAEPAMQAVAGKQIIIFRGQQGRELLAETLRARGAEVSYAHVYQRRKTARDPAELQQLLSTGVDIITITSGEALHYLLELAGPELTDKAKNCQLLVINQRLADLSNSLGFTKQAIISKTASDEAIVEAIQEWLEKNKRQ